MADFYSFFDARRYLEDEMTALQKRYISIHTKQALYEIPSAEKEARARVENEIEDRKNAIETLDAQSYCDCCGTKVEVDETCRIRITKSPKLYVMMDRTRVRVECSECFHKKDEIDREIEILWPSVQRQKLQKTADWRVRCLGRASRGSTGEDLLHEALVATLIGAENAGEGKHFNKSRADFSRYLWGAMRNISYCWKQKFKESEPFLESDIITSNAEGDNLSPLENIVSSNPAADQWLSAKEEVEQLFKKFAMDREASAILRAQLEGMTSAREIMQEYKLTKRHYESALKRIRCQKSVLVIEEHDQVRELVVRWLKATGFAVLAAALPEEGLRLHGVWGRFDVVVISHSLHLNGVELAMDIHTRDPSQKMIITTTYCCEKDVGLPSELAHIPILLKSFGKTEFLTVLRSVADTTLKEKGRNCRKKRRQSKTTRDVSVLLQNPAASRLPTPGRSLNTTLPS